MPTNLHWLTCPIVAEGNVVLDGLDLAHLTDGDLQTICLRMHVILDTIEMPRCEGRLMPREIFDEIDTLESLLLVGSQSATEDRSPPRLSQWLTLIDNFGDYYGLDQSVPIEVDAAIFREHALRLAI